MGDVEISLVPGHEAIGKITALGEDAKFLKVGQTVGLGWNSGSCLHSALSFGRSQHVPKPGANHYREAWCFNPLVQFAIRPTESRGVVGIGGLGHVALQFLNKWGCHVTASS